MKKPFALAAAPSLSLSRSHSLLAAIDGGAGDVQQQLGSPSDQTSTPTGPREPAKELTKEEKREQYEKYKDSDVKPMWMMGYKPE
jgi:hypothetical protein